VRRGWPLTLTQRASEVWAAIHLDKRGKTGSGSPSCGKQASKGSGGRRQVSPADRSASEPFRGSQAARATEAAAG
jgi:hypothetical protein